MRVLLIAFGLFVFLLGVHAVFEPGPKPGDFVKITGKEIPIAFSREGARDMMRSYRANDRLGLRFVEGPLYGKLLESEDGWACVRVTGTGSSLYGRAAYIPGRELAPP